ncbi:hypothetical protein C8R42DRAFT_775194 [Lentinula raphanica]|nr:hypothetical protein C8R42DRAFT_775194 [Lentinula raphanica]
MSITLPPLPATPSPSKRKRNDNKLKPISDTLQLRREMMKAIKFAVRDQPPTLGPTLSSLNAGTQYLRRSEKRKHKAAVLGVLKHESQFIMPWADDLFRKFSMESLKKQLPTVYSIIYPKKTIVEIEADVDLLMIRIGQRTLGTSLGDGKKIEINLSRFVNLMKIDRQPTEDVNASPETAIRRNEYVRYDHPRPCASSVKAPTLLDSPSKPKTKKRAREEDNFGVTVTIVKKAKKGIKRFVSSKFIPLP